MKKKYRFCLFDLDRTLWDFQTNAKICIVDLAHRHLLDKICGSGEEFFETYEIHNQKLWDLYDMGKISQAQLRSRRFAITLESFGINDPFLGETLDKEYLDMMPSQHRLMPHALEVLDALKAKGIPMAIVSNGFKKVQRQKVLTSGLEHYFSQIIISEEVGFNKPNPLIFLKAISSINARKEDTIMVGDDFPKDIEGAQVAGIDQFYYYASRPVPGITGATYQGDDLRQLLELF